MAVRFGLNYEAVLGTSLTALAFGTIGFYETGTLTLLEIYSDPRPSRNAAPGGATLLAKLLLNPSGTDLVIDGSNQKKVTSASYTFGGGDQFNTLHITAGTGFTVGPYVIDSLSSNT